MTDALDTKIRELVTELAGSAPVAPSFAEIRRRAGAERLGTASGRRFPTGSPWVRAAAGLAVLLGIGAVVGALAVDRNGDGGTRAATGSSSGVASGGASRAPRVVTPPTPGTSPSGPGGPDAAASTGQASVSVAASPAAGPGVAGSPAPPPPLPLVAPGSERVVKTANLQVALRRRQLGTAQGRVLQIVSGAGGFVQSSNVSDGEARFTLKVPVDRFEQALEQIRRLGKVTSDSVSGQDVSQEFVDLEARLRNERAQEAAYLDLLGKATSIPDVVAIRNQLGPIQQTIEELEGRRRMLQDQTAYSTVNLAMREPNAAAPETDRRSTLARAWDDAVHAGAVTIAGTVIVLGAVLPLVPVLALVALLVRAGIRRRRWRLAAVADGEDQAR